MLRGHAALAAYRQSLSVFIQDADHAKIELELVSEDLEYVIEYRLQVTAAGHKTGGIVKDAQLLPTGFTADVDRAEQVKDVLHVTATCGKIVFDNNTCRSCTDRAGQSQFRETL